MATIKEKREQAITKAEKIGATLYKEQNDFMMNVLIPAMKKDPLAIYYALEKVSNHYLLGGLLSPAFLTQNISENDRYDIRLVLDE